VQAVFYNIVPSHAVDRRRLYRKHVLSFSKHDVTVMSYGITGYLGIFLVYQLDEKDNNSGYNKDIEVVQILECLGILYY
jgi:hypothetical protein